ncbi:DUF3152 domain-containing protein [Actinacidiphila yeochonensis]|uniref:DUF3152 domain-containing protein n=1 Tax=Actinacidiphila yeochonensis TaxID=89050 RepID=UPI001E5D1093|nr:DUF3152 domain-containing protein [Actinacidiphila yeochonensis]
MAAQRSRAQSARGQGTGGSRGRHGRRRAKRPGAAVGPSALICLLVLGAGAGYAAWHRTTEGSAQAAASARRTAPSTTQAPDTAGPQGGESPATRASAASSPTATATSATPTATRDSSPPTVPKSGSGTFTTAQASGAASGHGRIRRYKVEVEGGIQLSAADAANEIAGILADPRGWENDGRDGFQLVSSGTADFVIKIATPDTTDAICGAAGLLTRGEVNCDVGAVVVVNLKRWELGSPEFDGPIHDYRALIINHEVGHRIGHGHESCPGPGKPAPVMMQQIKGLHGCVANAWPYDSKGNYIQGPPTA